MQTEFDELDLEMPTPFTANIEHYKNSPSMSVDIAENQQKLPQTANPQLASVASNSITVQDPHIDEPADAMYQISRIKPVAKQV